MTSPQTAGRAFRRALAFSAVAHATLIVLIAASPRLPLVKKPALVHYIPLNFGGLPGGGEGGLRARSGRPSAAEIPKASLRDLTTVQKMQDRPRSDLRYPTDKPKRDKTAEKKASVSAPQPGAAPSAQGSAERSGGGSGVRIGMGEGGGGGFGTGLASQIGLSDFPYTYYLQIITDRVSSNWFTSLVDPGVKGDFQSVVYFQIFRDGRISDVRIHESSGLRSLDQSAVRSVQRSSPFPPLPRDYDKDSLGIFLIFEHSR
ncbi:MAG: TonB C-terminal domain-containing protein [Candidatus Aminicenantes bacterium]|nr:TonB C-terminal domain-containing protein [Candidatus Aminicenantes bacterium]